MKARLSCLGLALLCACPGTPSAPGDSGPSPAPSDTGFAPSSDAGVIPRDAGVLPGPDGGASWLPDVSTLSLPRPPETCAVPAEGKLVDTSTPKTVVGTGSPESCTESALRTAIQGGGIITFDCGDAPHTIAVTSDLKINNHAGDVVIDGGGKITLSGGLKSRILWLNACEDPISPRCDVDPHPALTVQRLTFRDGEVRDTVPDAKGTKTGGGAIFRHGGLLTVIDCDFYDNTCDPSGQDVSGGAITSQQSQRTLIVGSNFRNNRCANGGAVGSLQAAISIFNSAFIENEATGNGGNRVPDASHAGDTGGNGGNGGAIVIDGQNNAVELCGVSLVGNRAHYAGGALFRTGYHGEPFSLKKSVVSRNVLSRRNFPETDYDHYNVALGTLYLQGIHATIEQTGITQNVVDGGAAGIFVAKMGGAGGVLDLTNVTLASNIVNGDGLGGALFGGEASGLLTNVTVFGNKANFAGGLAFTSGLTLKNTVIAENVRDDQDATGKWNPRSCFLPSGPCAASGPNLQWPQTNTTGKTDEPACAAGITFADPQLAFASEGDDLYLIPAASGAAVGKGTGCPAVDQHGKPRNTAACALGAVEP